MRSSKVAALALALLATGLCGVLLWKRGPREVTAPAEAASREIAEISEIASAEDPIAPLLESLGEEPSDEEVHRSLSELRLALSSMPEEEAIARIRDFLDRGDDRKTGLAFEIARGGKLSGWPSLRTFLLDTLLEIDPAAAAAVSREILSKPTNADEWALALRNVAKGEEREDRAFLLGKTQELIGNPAWQQKPSIGYLNAFDVLVHIEATESTPLLSNFIQMKDRKDLAHAGFLTLDRLVQRQPGSELPRLLADRELQRSRPEMVAQQFARADLRDPEQRKLVKDWLLDPARTATELSAFAGVYPNNNRFVSNNLLTNELAPSGPELAVHDRDALAVVSGWVADPAFAPVKDHLQAMILRLDEFVGGRK
ncbi:hypothetical protein [Luteolibacter luteus]|uniref:Uncharacterized protein n=1 Tax=Luteolibacter luteus TaxID=2728835 RepID=A0A858RKX2_9BACT|nr:hypothetical protein [Luteolibacter luteus]QJE97251.1 hypothetical protein HHL09_16130 [Luteolibacter luteus]